MSSCLGLYIEDNLIKYAKVLKNNDVIKVESFGVKFYENIGNAIKQIVEETYSFKIPITINTTEEIYSQIKVFSLLSEKDIDGAVKTEFEHICYNKEINHNIYEQRYILTKANINNDKINAIHIAVPKTSIEQRKKQFGEYRIKGILPLSLSISKLPKKEKKNVMIVNIEKNTAITKIDSKGNITFVKVIEEGTKEILENIKRKENSYLKAYEICKGSTIYIDSYKDLQYEENEYMEDIMPTLFKIVTQVKNVVEESLENIEKIYITGTGALVNNIDIYFQDNLKGIQCEILRPRFISNNSKINIKDYIEVNSAIAIALQGLEKESSKINFIKESKINQIWNDLKQSIGNKNESIDKKINIDGVLSKYKRQEEIVSFIIIFTTILYLIGSVVLNKRLDNKIAEVDTSIANTNKEISELQEYNNKINSRIDKYEGLIQDIQSINDVNSENKRFKNAIPNLLNNIMAVIPKSVNLTLIENTSDTHIVINATTSKYEQIAFFKTKLKVEGILENVVSNTGTINGGILTVTIEGELP